MRLTVISPEGVVLDVETHSVTLPGSQGAFTVLENHAPLMATLAAGRVNYVGGPSIEIAGGIAEVRHNKVRVICAVDGTNEAAVCKKINEIR